MGYRNRSVAIVLRDHKILMEEVLYDGKIFCAPPGGGIEEGETPEQAVIRELKEECGLDGKIVRKMAEVYSNGRTEHSFLVEIPEDQEPIVGSDPEEPVDAQPIQDVRWMALHEVSEKDRAFLCQYGITQIDELRDEIMSWGSVISYPKEKS